MSEDFYSVLGVSRDADEDEIREAYREKVREYHPDVSDDPDAEEKFKMAKKAKEVLTDEEQREMYDQLGHDRFVEAEKRGGVDGGGPGGGPRGGDPFGGAGGPFGDVQDIFDQFFGGGGAGRGGGRSQGRDLKTGLEIDLEEAYSGVEKQLNVRRPERCTECDGTGHPPGTDSQTCPECNGRGQTTTVQQTPLGRVQQTTTCRRCGGEGTVYAETCSACRGEGIVENESTLTVEIPAGIRDGQTLRMDGEGAPPEGRGPNGDLLVEIAVAPHPEFERDGDDLRKTVPVSFPTAVFGDTVMVETLDGAVELEVPAGTQSGETFRLRNKGMPRLQRRGNGDLYAQVQVVTPQDLNAEQREALQEFAEAGGEDIDVGRGFFEKIKQSF
ncbi:MAG: molecular chaperone DnaJ [Salinirussus sp.]